MLTAYHGTDVNSAISLNGGAPLDPAKAAALKSDGPPGFFLAADPRDAEFFAVRGGSGAVLQYDLSPSAVQRLKAAGP
jgi:hypothetical protein